MIIIVTCLLRVCTSHHISTYDITSHHITSLHISTYDITSRHITSLLNIRYHITSNHITSHHITLYHITSHHITSQHTISHVHRVAESVGLLLKLGMDLPSHSLTASYGLAHILAALTVTNLELKTKGSVSYTMFSCLVLSCLVLSCLILLCMLKFNSSVEQCVI